MALCPDNDISGGKVLWRDTRKVNSRGDRSENAGTVFIPKQKRARRLLSEDARKAWRTKGHYSRGPQTRPDHLSIGHNRQDFDESRFAGDQRRYHKHQEAKLGAKARALGFQLVRIDSRA